MIRLQRFLSTAGICSRREGEAFIQEGRVSVNDRIVVELGTKVDPKKDRIEVDGTPVVVKHRLIYIALHKPKGYVTTCRQTNEKIVIDLIDLPERIYPIGRLDKDSTGLLLLTNDGRLHHRLSHPSFDHEKEYEVTVAKPIATGALRKLEEGLPMMGTKTRPAEVKRISQRRFRIVLREGRNRQIRRMVRKMGNHIIRLHRIRMSNIRIGHLSQGTWRHLTEKEKIEILQLADLSETR